MNNSSNNNNSDSTNSSSNTNTTSTAAANVVSVNATQMSINSLDKNRYRNYAHPGKTLREPNYVMQHAAPSMLWLLRKIQPKPYAPLPPERIAQTVYPQDYSLRPSPHVAHQALIDFYRACNGQYGICVEDVTSMQLITKLQQQQQQQNNIDNNMSKIKSFNKSASSLESDHGNNVYTNNNNNDDDNDEREAKYAKYDKSKANPMHNETNISSNNNNNNNNNEEARLTVKEYTKNNDYSTNERNKNVQGHFASSGDNNNNNNNNSNDSDDSTLFSKELEQYRLQQFRRSAQHVDSSAYGKVCHYFQTKEGCRRGKYCPFLHLGKDGLPITAERNIN